MLAARVGIDAGAGVRSEQGRRRAPAGRKPWPAAGEDTTPPRPVRPTAGTL